MLGSYASHVSPQVGQPRTQRQAAAEGLPKHPKKNHGVSETPKEKKHRNFGSLPTAAILQQKIRI
jgi:hypothetical protein